jgi:hypothetical protein
MKRKMDLLSKLGTLDNVITRLENARWNSKAEKISAKEISEVLKDLRAIPWSDEQIKKSEFKQVEKKTEIYGDITLAIELAKCIRLRLSKEITFQMYDEIDKLEAAAKKAEISVSTSDIYVKVRSLAKGELVGKQRLKTVETIFRRLAVEQTKLVCKSYIKVLKQFRKKDKELQNGDALALIHRYSWKLMRHIEGYISDRDLSYKDTFFGPMIKRFEDIKKMLDDPAKFAEAQEQFTDLMQGVSLPLVMGGGKDVMKSYMYAKLYTEGAEFVLGMIATCGLVALARGWTIYRLTKGISTAEKIARSARWLRAMKAADWVARGTAAVAFTQVEMGMGDGIWLGYDTKNGKWEVAKTVEKTLLNFAMFGIMEVSYLGYVKAVKYFANMRGITMAEMSYKAGAKMSWKVAAFEAGGVAAEAVGFAVYQGGKSVYEEAKKGRIDPKAFAKAFEPKRLLHNAVLFGAIQMGRLLGVRLTRPKDGKLGEFLLGKHKELMKDVRHSFKDSTKALNEAAAKGDVKSSLKALGKCKKTLQKYAQFLESTGKAGTPHYKKVMKEISRMNAIQSLFGKNSVACAKVDKNGFFTYKLSRQQHLKDVLEKAGFKYEVMGNNKIMTWIEGVPFIFTPRGKPAQLSDGVIRFAGDRWVNLTPGQKTALRVIGNVAFFTAPYLIPNSWLEAIGLK